MPFMGRIPRSPEPPPQWIPRPRPYTGGTIWQEIFYPIFRPKKGFLPLAGKSVRPLKAGRRMRRQGRLYHVASNAIGAMSCGRAKAMGKKIDRIKRQEQLTPPEKLAGLIWDRAINSRDRIFRVPYYRFPCYIEYDHEHEDDSFTLDCLYLGQERSFMLVQPRYRDVLGVAPEILQWLDATYAMCCPPEPPRPRKGRRRRVANRHQIANSVLDMSPQNTPFQGPQKGPFQRPPKEPITY